MTLTTHALVGAAAASFFPQSPWLAFAAGVVSHFAADVIPHWDYKYWLRSVEEHPNKLQNRFRTGPDFWHDLRLFALDALLGFVLTFVVAYILSIPQWLALIGAGAGLYPDLLTFVYSKMREWAPAVAELYEPIQRFHNSTHWKELHHIPAWQGIVMQLLVVAIAVWLARAF